MVQISIPKRSKIDEKNIQKLTLEGAREGPRRLLEGAWDSGGDQSAPKAAFIQIWGPILGPPNRQKSPKNGPKKTSKKHDFSKNCFKALGRPRDRKCAYSGTPKMGPRRVIPSILGMICCRSIFRRFFHRCSPFFRCARH